MRCNYRYCGKEINFGRPDRKFCNKNCKIREKNLIKESKSLENKSIKTRDFIEKSKKIHNNKYGYELSIYDNCRTKILIICPIHGMFEQTPSNHLYNKQGCAKCVRDERKLTLLSDIRIDNLKRVHNNKYLYNDLSINNGFINITCPVHGNFTQYLYFHEYGHGCPQCNSSYRGEDYIKNYLDMKGIRYHRNFIFENCKNKKGLRFDFYLYDDNTIIEYDGEHHFIGIKEYIRKNDEIKNKYCLLNSIRLVRIPYYDYNNIESILNSVID